MKRFLLSFFLIIFIISLFSYLLFYLSFNFFPQNQIDINYRKDFIKTHFLRKVFKLNKIGDARFDYALNKDFKNLNIIIYSPEGEALDPQTLKNLPFELKKIVYKTEINIINKNFKYKPNDTIEDADLNQLINNHPAYWPVLGNSAVLQVFVLKKYATHPTYAGLVKNDSNIFLFMDSIINVSDRQISNEKAEISTILHEFGHLLGADHVEDDETCVMAEKVEDLTEGLPNNMPTTYCPDDILEIQKSLSI